MGSAKLSGRGALLRRVSGISLCAVSVAAVVSACGSDSEKKRAPTYDGDAGEAAVGGQSGGGGSGGSAGSGGTLIATGGAPAGDAGGGGKLPSDGGASGTGQAGAGEAGGATGGEPGTECSAGSGDCDQNPDDCETPLDTIQNCGECGTTCTSTNGVSACQELSCVVTSCTAGFADCNDSGTDGCETATNTVTNCGSCNNDCGTGTCNAGGFCNGVDVGSNAYTGRSFLAGDSIYRQSVPAPGYGLQSSYSIIRTPVNGSAETIIDAQNKPAGGMVATATDVYWGVGGTPPGVFKKGLTAAAGVAPTPVFEPPSLPMQLVIQGANLYFTGLDGQIYLRPLAAASNVPGTVIVTAAEVAGTHTFNLHQPLVATPTRLYWIVGGTGGPFLRTAPIAGGTAADVAGATPRGWTPLWVNGEDVYWVQTSGSAFDGVYRYASGAAATGLVFKSNLTGVATDSGSLYYLETDNKLFKSPIAGGVGKQIGQATSGAKDIIGFGPKSTYLSGYWTRGNGFSLGKAYVLSK
ncbi:MAG: hypothetical protein EOO73_13550 [Myxococcales bacterium]|nr:MAG: hypothetical protein EOO73_13550 [Myxococcales bacterium]